ncbi:MAG: hypothetical protein ACLGG7_12875 [Bacteriovoracia bacterium]
MKFIVFSVLSVLAITGLASTTKEMNRALDSLTKLLPFLTHEERFLDKKSDAIIKTQMTELNRAFKGAKHEAMLKNDLFAPSYALVVESLDEANRAFAKGQKDYAFWRLKEITNFCVDCHTRMPEEFASSFQNGELRLNEKDFENAYTLGVSYLIVRRYPDAKAAFQRTIADSLVTKTYTHTLDALKQTLLIDVKVQKNFENLEAEIKAYLAKDLPADIDRKLEHWLKRVPAWKNDPALKGISDEKALTGFIQKKLLPLRKSTVSLGHYDVDLLVASGLLANYLFLNPQSPQAADVSFWLGWGEKHLKRENFFSTGNHFFKQCIRRYPKSAIAKSCFEEYKESVEFDFTGSAGTQIPADIQRELKDLEKLIKN